MRIVVIGVEGIEIDLLLADPRLVHVQALVAEGIVGRLVVENNKGMWTLWSAISTRDEDEPLSSPVESPDSEPRNRLGTAEAERRATYLGMVSDDGPGTTQFDEIDDGGEASSNRDDRRPGVDAQAPLDGPRGDAPESCSRLRACFERFRQRLECRAGNDAAILIRRLSSPGRSAEDRAIGPRLASFDDELRRTLEHLLERGDEVTILLVVLETPLEAKGDERDRPTRSGAFVISSSRGLPAGEIEGARWSDLAPTLLKLAGKPIPDGLAGMPLELEGMVPRVEEDEQAVLERLRGLGYLS